MMPWAMVESEMVGLNPSALLLLSSVILGRELPFFCVFLCQMGILTPFPLGCYGDQ